MSFCPLCYKKRNIRTSDNISASCYRARVFCGFCGMQWIEELNRCNFKSFDGKELSMIELEQKFKANQTHRKAINNLYKKHNKELDLKG